MPTASSTRPSTSFRRSRPPTVRSKSSSDGQADASAVLSDGARLASPMRAVQDPDLLLIEQMLAPPPLADARDSLAYWQTRRKSLPLYRRAARREAKEMAVRWQERVRAAELARFEASPIGRLLARLGISSIWFQRVQLASQLMSWVFWA